MSKQFSIFYCLFAAVLMPLGSCRKDICYEEYHPHSRKVMVEVDYSQMDTIPDEMRINFYSLTSGEELTRFVSPQKPYVDLPVGKYKAIIFNDNSEYISLRNERDYSSFAAFLSPLTRAQYNMMYGGNSVAHFTDNGETTVITGTLLEKPLAIDPSALLIGQPDFFYVDNNEELEITDDTHQQNVLSLCPQNQISLCYIKANVAGLEHVQQVRGMLTNVSPGICFHDLTRDSYTAVVLFDFKKEKEIGCITATVSSFGFLLNGEGNGARQVPPIINVEFLLSDNSIYKASFQLNPIVDIIPQSVKKIVLDDIVIEAPSLGNGGGFDVGIDDWLDEETIPIN